MKRGGEEKKLVISHHKQNAPSPPAKIIGPLPIRLQASEVVLKLNPLHM